MKNNGNHLVPVRRKQLKISKEKNDKINEPASMLDRTANATLENLTLSKKEITGAVSAATISTVAASIPGLGRIVEWGERVDQELKERKLKKILKNFGTRFQSIEEAVGKFQFIIASQNGQTLFRKIIEIVGNKTTIEDEFLSLMANILANIADSDIEKHFAEYEFSLSQIERLSPQAVIILSKHATWERADISGTTTTSGQTVAGDWDSQAANFFSRKLSITEAGTILRIGHSFLELEKEGLIVLSGDKIKPTIIGGEVCRILNRK